jgi:hypothetical protein
MRRAAFRKIDPPVGAGRDRLQSAAGRRGDDDRQRLLASV